MPTILVIDDDIAVRTSLNLLLKQAGYQVHTAAGSSEALKSLQETPVDLIIMVLPLLLTFLRQAKSIR